jgi:hypothetical protein
MKRDHTKRVALYARVSTDGQSVENQLRELETVAVKEGWEVVERFIDRGISGARGREGRPAFDRLYRGIVRREFDVVAAWSGIAWDVACKTSWHSSMNCTASTQTSTSTSKASIPPRQAASYFSRCSVSSLSLREA